MLYVFLFFVSRNFLIDKDLNVVVTDFGLVHDTQSENKACNTGPVILLIFFINTIYVFYLGQMDGINILLITIAQFFRTYF